MDQQKRGLADFDSSAGEYTAQTLADAQASAAMVVLVKGEQCYVLHYGTCSDESRLPVDGQTVFDTGSCGKAFTATAAALQVSRGKLAWDDPLCELVPEFQLYDEWVSKNVTLRDALGNRLCIQRETPLEFGVDASVPMTELLRRARFARRLYPFRDRFAYSNLGFMAASLAVSRSDGRPYAQFLKEELLTPLGMSRTLPVGGLAPGDVNAAVAYTNVNGKRTAVPEFVDANYEGCGGLYSSSDDLARWLRFNLGGGGELLPSAFETLHRPQVRMDPQRTLLWHTPPDALFPSYGLGWSVTHLAGRRLVQHAGEVPGTLATIAFLPEEGIGVAVCVASALFPVHSVLTYHLLEAALGLPPRDWRAAALQDIEKRRARSAAQLPEQARTDEGAPVDVSGVYRSRAAGDVSITGGGDTFILEYPDSIIWRQRLERQSGNLFHGVFTEPAGLAYSTDHMPVWFSFDGSGPGAIHHPFFGRAEKLAGSSLRP